MAALPDYVASAQPVPQDNRVAWYKSTAPTYAGIMLWFVFWQDVVSGSATPAGSLASGLGVALLALVVAALFCHFLTYLVPGLLGVRTGLPLYVVGTSTYGVRGGFIMPGFLMGVLQFGWLAVNALFSAKMICESFAIGLDAETGEALIPGPVHGLITVAFILLAVFVGLKGIQYVARVATYMPLIFLAILLLLFAKTMGGLPDFTPETLTAAYQAPAEGVAPAPLGALDVFLFVSLYVVGFFATAGAAGVDFGMNNRDGKDVQLGGLTGIVGATIVAGGLAMLIVAGAYGAGMIVTDKLVGDLNPVSLMPDIVGVDGARWMRLFLAIAAFAPACFPAFIAANSFRTTLPKVSPWISVGAGTVASAFLAASGLAGQAVSVFLVIGASFGPICGAMAADFLLAGRKWAGPRAGFNLAGWISWAVGFVVGAIDLLAGKIPALEGLAVGIPCPPMAAFVVGFVLYLLLAKAGLESESLRMPAATE